MTCAGNKKALNSGSLLARAQHARNDWNSGTVNKHATADRLFHNEKKRTKQQDMAIVRKIDQKGPRGKLALEESVLQEEQLADPQKESPQEEK